jgi:formate C-acetyltransferase
METNSVLGNSQHVVTIGGLTPDGGDATNELSYLVLDAFERMGGAVNQLAVRVHRGSPEQFVRRAVEVFRRTNGIAFYGDEPVVEGLLADGLTLEDARDYCVVGCIETSGQSNTHGCVGGHELVLPAVLLLTLSRGRRPAPFLGQGAGFDSGALEDSGTFDEFCAAFRRQLAHQVDVLVRAAAGKDRAYIDLLPAPYVSALMDGCIDAAADVTAGGAKYDFTSLDVRGLATLVDSLLAVKTFVYDRRALGLAELATICERDFVGHEVLRQRLLHEPPKYGTGGAEGIDLARRVLEWLHGDVSTRRNPRGGRWRMCYYSYGNHVIDGFLLGATPDGRRRGEPTSNGVSPSNLIDPSAGPTGVLRTVAGLPARLVTSGVSLNMRFFPDFIATDNGLDAFAAMLRTYFALGGMHLQPNVISTETLRDAQLHPERYRDLVVKVSGYSAFYTDLGRSIQDDIIARCEFSG